jgi:hypothetical protein
VVSEQYPKGGALLLNAVSGVGMIFAGTIGTPAIGTLQDRNLASAVQSELPSVFPDVVKTEKGQFFEYEKIDSTKVAKQTDEVRDQINTMQQATKQQALAKIAVLPAIMFVCYVALIMYFKSRGGYSAQVLTGHAAEDERFTGGTLGPGEG